MRRAGASHHVTRKWEYIYIRIYVSAQQEIFTHLTFDGCERFDAIYFDWISLPRQVAALSVCPSVCLPLPSVCQSVRCPSICPFWLPGLVLAALSCDLFSTCLIYLICDRVDYSEWHLVRFLISRQVAFRFRFNYIGNDRKQIQKKERIK